MSSFSSNLFSNSLAFIYINLLFSGPADREGSDAFASVGEDTRPVLVADQADHEETGSILGPRRNLDKIGIVPQRLGLDKIDAVLALVYRTLPQVKLEFHGIDIIPPMWR